MSLLRIESVHLHYGEQVLLDNVSLEVSAGDKLGLLGRNGAGKTSLMKVLAGELTPDDGERWLRPGTTIARLEQGLPDAADASVYDTVAAGLAEAGELLLDYHRLSQAEPAADLAELSRVQQALEDAGGWHLQQRVETTLSQLDLPADTLLGELSGGWRRRVALARALVREPDILLLDEPTNHLDIPAIEWLEQQVAAFPGAVILITHDRRFLQRVTNRIAELDRGRLLAWRGDYRSFLGHREQQQQAEERADALFDKKLAQEEIWIRQGIKARRTRNEGRVRALKNMRDEQRARREKTGTARLSLDQSERSGKLVSELQHVGKAFGEHTVLQDVSTIVQRGDRVGIVGPNGAGKTTLVRILLGELAPDTGSVQLGTKLEIAYSDQLRAQLDPDKDLIDNVCGGREFIDIGGRRRHAISYLGDFLFGPERVRTPVRALSGGEQNRAVLARVFSKPANLLVLDEPTNDLDIETLELLEELLLGFQGTVLLVSHDRQFMDNVVTSLLVLEGDGSVTEEAGGYSDWEARRQARPAPSSTNDSPAEARGKTSVSAQTKPGKVRKLSYNEQRELSELPERIESLESEIATLEQRIAEPDFYQGEHTAVQAVLEEMAEAQAALETAFERWTSLEDHAG